MKVYGPYIHTSGRSIGRRYVRIISSNKQTTMLYSRFLMEIHLNRKLKYDECVDHINEDNTDDRIENLQVLSRSANARKTFKIKGKKAKTIKFNCPYCNTLNTKSAAKVRHNKSQGKAGPFCNKQCAGKWQFRNH